MNTLIATVILAVLVAVGRAAPTNAPITDISALKEKAEHEITSVYQEIQQLESRTVRFSSYIIRMLLL